MFDDSIVERYISKGTWAKLEKINLKGEGRPPSDQYLNKVSRLSDW